MVAEVVPAAAMVVVAVRAVAAATAATVVAAPAAVVTATAAAVVSSTTATAVPFPAAAAAATSTAATAAAALQLEPRLRGLERVVGPAGRRLVHARRRLGSWRGIAKGLDRPARRERRLAAAQGHDRQQRQQVMNTHGASSL
jgi:hypothetical protein